MKHLSLLMVLTMVFCFAMITGCKGGGGQAAALASTGTEGVTPGDGATDPGAGTGTLPAAVSLAWDAPSTNTDGSALTNLGGYKIHYGSSPGNYTGVLDVGLRGSYSLSDLAPGTYYFTVTAYNRNGSESESSNEVNKTVEL